MKKTKLLITLLVMLVAASGFAQDSYREAVKQYLTAMDQFENTKSLISNVSILFDRNGQVDIDQLTKRYIDEQFENDMIDWFEGVATLRDMTEADLKEVTSLLSSPEGKSYQTHQKEWMADFLTNFMMTFMMASQQDYDEMEIDENEDWSSMSFVDLLGDPIQPNPDIDAAYAAKYNDVIMESDFGKNMMNEMLKRFDSDTPDDPEEQESHNALRDWMATSVPALMLNSACGNLSLEDLDYTAMLYSNESYCKLNSFGADDLENLKVGQIMVKYLDWMKEQGATASEDPAVAMEFYKALLGNSTSTWIPSDTENDNSSTPWYDLNLEDLEQGE